MNFRLEYKSRWKSFITPDTMGLPLLFAKPMKTHPFVLESPLSLQECIHRLQSSISPQGMSFFAVWDSGNKEFHGTIDENSIELRKRKSWFWKNDFAPHLFAQLHPTPSGTRIEGHFSISSKVAMFMTIWLVAVAGFGVAFVIQSLITGFSDP